MAQSWQGLTVTIRNAEAYAASQWDWACLRGCFGETKIEPTDIDGFVERNARFLVIETKMPGVPVKFGQELTFKRLVETGRFTVLVIWGHAGYPEKARLITRQMDKPYEFADMDVIRNIVSQWFTFADGAYQTSSWCFRPEGSVRLRG